MMKASKEGGREAGDRKRGKKRERKKNEKVGKKKGLKPQHSEAGRLQLRLGQGLGVSAGGKSRQGPAWHREGLQPQAASVRLQVGVRRGQSLGKGTEEGSRQAWAAWGTATDGKSGLRWGRM